MSVHPVVILKFYLDFENTDRTQLIFSIFVLAVTGGVKEWLSYSAECQTSLSVNMTQSCRNPKRRMTLFRRLDMDISNNSD